MQSFVRTSVQGFTTQNEYYECAGFLLLSRIVDGRSNASSLWWSEKTTVIGSSDGAHHQTIMDERGRRKVGGAGSWRRICGSDISRAQTHGFGDSSEGSCSRNKIQKASRPPSTHENRARRKCA